MSWGYDLRPIQCMEPWAQRAGALGTCPAERALGALRAGLSVGCVCGQGASALFIQVGKSIAFKVAVVLNGIMLLWIWVYKHLWDPAFDSLGNRPRNGIAASRGASMSTFFWGTSVGPSTILHFYQPCSRVPVSLCPHQHVLFPGFWQ